MAYQLNKPVIVNGKKATIFSYSRDKKRACVKYDDGTSEWIDVEQIKG